MTTSAHPFTRLTTYRHGDTLWRELLSLRGIDPRSPPDADLRGTAPDVILGLVRAVLADPGALAVVARDPAAASESTIAIAERVARGDRIVLVVSPDERGRIIAISAPTPHGARVARVLDHPGNGHGETFAWSGCLVARAGVLFGALAEASPELVRLCLYHARWPEPDEHRRTRETLEQIDLLDLVAPSSNLWLLPRPAMS